MEASLVLGRIRGIPIGIHSSWLIIFGLLTFSLAGQVFPTLYPGWTAAAYWITGALASLLLFASVVAHELGHAFAAQQRGIPVRSITLFIFGGVAVLGEETEQPGDELWIAVAGPAVSLLIAALAGLAWTATRGLGGPPVAVLWYLMAANVLLVVFNLIPAYPLDGGRVLRAILWRMTGSLLRGTRMAANVGMVIGFLFIAFGVFLVFQAPISGIWLVAIGWFLRTAAQQATQHLMLRSIFAGTRVDALMTRDPITVSPDVTIADLVDHYILAHNARGLPVTEGRSLLGIVTLTDVKQAPRAEWSSRRVGEVMTPRDRLVTVSPDSALDTVLGVMSERDIRQLPVLRDGELVGLLTRNALIQFLHVRESLPTLSADVPPRGDRGEDRAAA